MLSVAVALSPSKETKDTNEASDKGVGGKGAGGKGVGGSGVVSGYTAAASHFDRLFSHYGGHITVLNLV